MDDTKGVTPRRIDSDDRIRRLFGKVSRREAILLLVLSAGTGWFAYQSVGDGYGMGAYGQGEYGK